MSRVLIIDGDESFSFALRDLLIREGCSVDCSSVPRDAVDLIQKQDVDFLVLETGPEGSGELEILRQVREISPRALVFLTTAKGSLETAVQGFRLGAHDYLVKPLSAVDVAQKAVRLIEARDQAEQLQHLRRSLRKEYQFGKIVGKSLALAEVLEMVKRVAPTQATVLITGESGTGKELIARAIHDHSDREKRLFLPVNCGALPETLLESLLFGHMKGSFTGAFTNQEGLFEKAGGGTIFLDEIGEIPQHLQVKLLRALEAKEILPIGSTTPRQIDVRVLAASNRNLKKEVEKGAFRDDLYYRLNIMEIHIPPLRERPEDIPLLVEHLIQKHNPELKRSFRGAEGAVVRLLMSLPWKGNVRELDNVIEHAMILAEGDWIALNDLPQAIVAGKEYASAYTHNLKDSVKQFEKQHILRILELVGQDRKEAATLLDISLSSLYRKMDELGIS